MKPSMAIVVITGCVMTLHTISCFFGGDQLAAIRGALNMIGILLAIMVALQMERGSSWNG